MAERNHDEGIDFRAVKNRFMILNRERLLRTRDSLRDKQFEMLELLPLLFHVNHPMLPGFSSRETPAGVWGYEPDDGVLRLARAHAKSFAYRRSPHKYYPIQALYFMGSTGTIAHAEGSDFDFWLCHDPALSQADKALLQSKARALELWAGELGLEVHFFLVNADEFRSGKVLDLSSESSGSSQHYLLLDEFYRSSVLLAGMFPLWWLVPPEHEGRYDEYVEDLKRKRFLYARDCLDFGGLHQIPAEEFIGAALWQLSKGIDSPYKSLLKLILIESYASEYPQMDLLSKRLKQSVYLGKLSPQHLDPYIMMLNKVSEYLGGEGEHKRLDVARRCFYFKTAIKLTDKFEGRRYDWRRELLENLVDGWGWNRAELTLLDAHHTWKVGRVVEERQILFDALISSYRFLSDFTRRHAGLAMISQQDLTTLGRKLYTAFERKAGKVDIINRGIYADLYEEHVTLCEIHNDEADVIGWHLYRGVVQPQDARMEVPLKRSRGLIELLAWAWFNKVISRNSALVVFAPRSRHTLRDMEHILSNLMQHFPLDLLESGDIRNYEQSASLLVDALFINTGMRASDNMTMTKNIAAMGQTDPFRYGHDQVNLVMAVDHLQVNSWREVTTHRNVGDNAVVESLCDYLKWYPRSSQIRPPVPHVYAMGAILGNSAGRRVAELYHQVIELFYAHDDVRPPRYLITIGHSHFVLEMDGDVPHYHALRSYAALLKFLGKTGLNHPPLVFDERSLKDSFLSLIYTRNKSGMVQFFYHAKAGQVEIYVLDERGALFSQQSIFYDSATLLNQFSRFFEAIANRINFMQENKLGTRRINGVEFYEMRSDALGRKDLQRVSPGYSSAERFLSLQVIVEQLEPGQSAFTLYCDNQEFSSLEYGKGLFAAVNEHVFKLRSSGQSYPVYITDISLDSAEIGEDKLDALQTTHFLAYKRRIEEQLNQ